MFYNNKNEKEIEDLSSMLTKKNFTKIKSRLNKAGTRTGFACIFSGYPGTGKTETAYQIARRTGRDIMKVDMASIRSKWWGEDEKNIKSIFNTYKNMIKERSIEPILLLNEADAIIGKRLDVEGNNGAIITSINTVQNIILEELENFQGILIATTNLTQNMDSAFERRFLYKIDFENPETAVKAKLWQYILSLSEEESLILANEFDFTGAQIENVFRKKTANSILYNETYTIDKIKELCHNENLGKETKRIGFGA
jgi:SpoVK/Ycf46/Vps4 family AAA+-type ATPase